MKCHHQRQDLWCQIGQKVWGRRRETSKFMGNKFGSCLVPLFFPPLSKEKNKFEMGTLSNPMEMRSSGFVVKSNSTVTESAGSKENLPR